MRKIILTALVAALPAGAAIAQSAEDVAKARQGFYKLLGLEMGQLAAMAKGEIDYDADKAMGHAADMLALTKYNPADLFAPGTSNADLPGVTRALPAIWEDFEAFRGKGAAYVAAVTELNAAAGNGRAELGQAVGKLGGTCKACHDDFRAADF